MKYCPNCKVKYDYEMSFCLQDGTPLQIEDSPFPGNSGEKTLVMPQPSQMQSSIETENFSEKTLNLPENVISQPTIAPTEMVIQPPAVPPTQYVIDAPNDWNNKQTDSQLNKRSNPNNAVFTTPQFETAQPRKSGFGLLIGLTAAALLVITTAIGGILFYFQQPSKEVAVANTNSGNNKPNQIQVNSPDGNTNVNLSQVFTANSNLENRLTSNSTNKPATKDSNATDISPKPTASVITRPSIEDGTPIPTKTPITKPTNENTPQPEVPKVVSGGVVNGKAVNLVKPPYPPAARAVHASGMVNVQVTIDENGNVISASAVSGHPLLRQAAEQAARASKFAPTQLSGQRVKVTGVIVYNFTAQ